MTKYIWYYTNMEFKYKFECLHCVYIIWLFIILFYRKVLMSFLQMYAFLLTKLRYI